jgi:hypothetical protein
MAQKPDATLVAGFHRWKALGRYVRRGEKGTWIMAPYKRWVEPEEDSEGREASASSSPVSDWEPCSTSARRTAPLPEPPPVQTELGATTAGELLDRRLSRWLIEEGPMIVLMSQELDPASKAGNRRGDCRA